MRVRTWLLYIALGLLLTCAVALACSYRAQRWEAWYNTDSAVGYEDLTGPAGVKWFYSEVRVFGASRLLARRIENDGFWGFFLSYVRSKPAHAPRYFASALRSEEQQPDAFNLFGLQMTSFGLPFRCLYYSQRFAEDAATPEAVGDGFESIHVTTHGALQVTKKDALTPLVLPYRILWLGMLADTILFAGLTLITLRGPRWFIRRRRLRLGCCLNCGYSRAGSTSPRCPECGVASPI